MSAKFFVNLSNHHSDRWGDMQTAAAHELADEIVDVYMPEISPWDSIDDVLNEAASSVDDILEAVPLGEEEVVVLVQGESTFVLAVVAKLLSYEKVKVVAPTTKRIIVEKPDGKTNRRMKFVQFREYKLL